MPAHADTCWSCAGASSSDAPVPRSRRLPAALRIGGAALLASLAAADGDMPQVQFTIGRKYPHRSDCFTEGLFLNGSQEIFESCGLTGRSYLRRYNLETGDTLSTAQVPRQFFAEGIAQLGNSLYLLTYRSAVLIEYDARNFQEIRRHPYIYGEGWGITTDGCDILLTTGKDFIVRLHVTPNGLDESNKITVRQPGGEPVTRLNEMEYVTPKVWINQWLTNNLWRVDPETGTAEAMLSVKGLQSWRGDMTPNGIAYSTSLGPDRLLVTGKLWPKMFLLRVAPADLCGGTPSTGGGRNYSTSSPRCPSAPPSACWTGAGTAVAAKPAAAHPAGGDDPIVKAPHRTAPPWPADVTIEAWEKFVRSPGSASSQQTRGGEPAEADAPQVGQEVPAWVAATTGIASVALCASAYIASAHIAAKRRLYKAVITRPSGSCDKDDSG